MCRSARFGELVDEHSNWTQLADYTSATRWRVHKSVLKESARVARNEAHIGGTGSCALVAGACGLAHLSRCMVHQNVARMEALLCSCSDAQEFFEIKFGVIHLKDPCAFATVYDREWRSLLQSEQSYLRSQWQPATPQSKRALKHTIILLRLS